MYANIRSAGGLNCSMSSILIGDGKFKKVIFLHQMDQLNTIYDILSSDTSGLSIINTLPILSQILTKTSSDPTTR